MSYNKYYCLRCKKPNMGCKCTNTDMHFSYSHKLRVPTSTKNKARFRKFLDDCPNFVNMVSKEQQESFLMLLKEINYFDKSINGCQWTNIKK